MTKGPILFLKKYLKNVSALKLEINITYCVYFHIRFLLETWLGIQSYSIKFGGIKYKLSVKSPTKLASLGQILRCKETVFYRSEHKVKNLEWKSRIIHDQTHLSWPN